MKYLPYLTGDSDNIVFGPPVEFLSLHVFDNLSLQYYHQRSAKRGHHWDTSHTRTFHVILLILNF